MSPPFRLLLEQLVRAAIPDLDRAGSVLSRRDLTLEVGVVERMVLDVHRQMPLPRLLRYALWHCPAGERAAALEPQVVVQPPGRMALHDEDGRGTPLPTAPERLRCPGRVALAAVLLERHVMDILTIRAASRLWRLRGSEAPLADAEDEIWREVRRAP